MNTRPEVESRIYVDTGLQYPYNSYSSRHYCLSGATEQRCRFVATDMAAGYLEANRIPGATYRHKIEIAIVPHPDHPGLYMLEDRSEEKKQP